MTQNSTNLLLSIVSVVLLSGCGSPRPVPPPQTVTTLSTVYTPPLNEVSKAEIGKTILSAEMMSRTPGIFLGRRVVEKINPPGTSAINSGELPFYRSNSEGEFYQGKATYSMLGQSVQAGERVGIFVPKDETKPAVMYHFANKFIFGKIPVTDYKRITITTLTPESFKRELIYTGVSQNTVSLQYREFKDNLARPAFTQELKYDLSQSKEIGYNGARFEIISAGNVELTYKVIKPLD